MPLYKYNCPECNKEFEVFQKITEYKSSHDCPLCGTDSNRSVKDFGTSFSVRCDGFYGRSK